VGWQENSKAESNKKREIGKELELASYEAKLQKHQNLQQKEHCCP